MGEIKLRYMDFKRIQEMRPYDVYSVKDTYDSKNKTIVAEIPDNWPTTVDGIYKYVYVDRIRHLSKLGGAYQHAPKSVALAAHKIETELKGKKLSDEDRTKMYRRIVRPSEPVSVVDVFKLSDYLGYSILEDDPDKHLENKTFKKIKPIQKQTPRTTRTKKLSTKTKEKKKIKGKPGYKKTTIAKKGYCVSESKQTYWKRRK